MTIADVNAAFAKGTLTSERLTQMFLARIDAYDRKGPALRAVITVNPKALETARAMDAERKTKGPRSPLHGIPIVLKDNIDTADLPTTGGSVLLEGSMPPDDAFVVKKLRAAGAVIVAKVNLSEFASGAAHSSLGGQILNPHDLTRTPAGSSGGTGASIAAAFAMAGLGTDTGGSVRGPSTANGIAGLKTTMGLVSRDGVIPLALSFDTVGPMARSVHDVAAMLSVIAGVDPADASTKAGEGRGVADYTQVAEGRRAERRAARHRARFPRPGHRRRLGDGSVARSDAQAGRHGRRRAAAEMAARCEGRVLQRHPLSGVRRPDRRLPEDDSVRSIRRTSPS